MPHDSIYHDDSDVQRLWLLLTRRSGLGRIWAEQLSHGIDATDTRNAITQVEQAIRSLDAGYCISAASYWAQQDAARLHRPWETLTGCRGCVGVVSLSAMRIGCGSTDPLTACPSCGHHTDLHHSLGAASGADQSDSAPWTDTRCAVPSCGCPDDGEGPDAW